MNTLDVVALAVDCPDDKLRRGQVGTIVELLSHHTYLVEFADLNGEAYELVPIEESHLITLHHSPALAE